MIEKIKEIFETQTSLLRKKAGIFKEEDIECAIDEDVVDCKEIDKEPYVGVPAPVLTPHDDWFEDPPKSEMQIEFEAFRQEDKDLRLLAYKVLVDKFNKKYSKLDESQAKVLREYINNISNTERLRTMLQEVVAKQLKTLRLELKHVNDKVVKIKLKEVAKQLKNSLTTKQKIDEKKILNILRLSELVNEVINARK